jgi:hypothetical protein
MRRGASWFFTVAALSGINSLLQIFDAKIRFIFGLGITQVAGSLAGHTTNGTVVLLWSTACSLACCCCAENGREKNRRAHSSVA